MTRWAVPVFDVDLIRQWVQSCRPTAGGSTNDFTNVRNKSWNKNNLFRFHCYGITTKDNDQVWNQQTNKHHLPSGFLSQRAWKKIRLFARSLFIGRPMVSKNLLRNEVSGMRWNWSRLSVRNCCAVFHFTIFSPFSKSYRALKVT